MDPQPLHPGPEGVGVHLQHLSRPAWAEELSVRHSQDSPDVRPDHSAPTGTRVTVDTMPLGETPEQVSVEMEAVHLGSVQVLDEENLVVLRRQPGWQPISSMEGG